MPLLCLAPNCLWSESSCPILRFLARMFIARYSILSIPSALPTDLHRIEFMCVGRFHVFDAVSRVETILVLVINKCTTIAVTVCLWSRENPVVAHARTLDQPLLAMQQ